MKAGPPAVSDVSAKRRLLKLADLLDSLDESKFDFATWGDVDEGEVGTDALKNATLCGTKACALGWAPSLTFAKKAGYSLIIKQNSRGYKYGDFVKNGRPVDPYMVAKELFGVNRTQFYKLFVWTIKNDAKESAHDIAENIRLFCSIRY